MLCFSFSAIVHIEWAPFVRSEPVAQLGNHCHVCTELDVNCVRLNELIFDRMYLSFWATKQNTPMIT